MRKSFGGSHGSGGGGNGGEMLKTVGKIVRTRLNHFQESLPSPNNNTTSASSPIKKTSSSSTAKNTKSKHALSLSSSPIDNNNNGGGGILATNLPVSAAANWAASSSSPTYYCSVSDGGDNNNSSNNEGDQGDDNFYEVESDWKCLENYYDPIFGVIPSTFEVHHALSSLHQVLHPHSCSTSTIEEIPCEVDKDMDDQMKSDAGSTPQRTSSKGSDSDWLEPSMNPYYWKVTQSPGWGRVHDAFHLLQNEPNVQKMVVSLSSDKAVWDAVLNNEAVREIRDSYRDAAESVPTSSNDEQLNPPKGNSSVLRWIFQNMKMKLLEVLGSMSQIVSETFKALDNDKDEQNIVFKERLKSTFLLTIVVLLIVVVARGHKP